MTHVSIPLPELNEGKKRAKIFLFRIASALHGVGCFSFDTERNLEAISQVLGVPAVFVVRPASIQVNFEGADDAHTSESKIVRVSYGINVHKAACLSDLCYNLRHCTIRLEEATVRLHDIEVSPNTPKWIMALSFFCLSAASAGGFYDGSWMDVGVSGVLGLVTFALMELCHRVRGLVQLECFVIAFMVSLISSTLNFILKNRWGCLYAQMFSPLVAHLPGLSITLALQELFSKKIVYGSSRFFFATSQALQLGVGLTLAYQLVRYSPNNVPESFSTGCDRVSDPNFLPAIDRWWGILFIFIFGVSVSMSIGASRKELPGMVCSIVVAHASNTFIVWQGPFVPCMIMTVFARVFGYITKTRTIPYIYAGVLPLVPGGVALKGMQQLMIGENEAVLQLTMNMIQIGVLLALGVFLAKIPRKKMCVKRVEPAHSEHNEFRQLLVDPRNDPDVINEDD